MVKRIAFAHVVVLMVGGSLALPEPGLPAGLDTFTAIVGLGLPVLAQASDQTATCGPIAGRTQSDLRNVRQFCAGYVPANRAVVGAYAMSSILRIKVSRPMADQMRADRLTAEQLVKTWMRAWKINSASRSVTITVEWMDVEIAAGQTSVLRGDEVTIH